MGSFGRWLGEPPRIPVRGCRGDLYSIIGKVLMVRTQLWQPPIFTLEREAGLCPHDRLPQARDG